MSDITNPTYYDIFGVTNGFPRKSNIFTDGLLFEDNNALSGLLLEILNGNKQISKLLLTSMMMNMMNTNYYSLQKLLVDTLGHYYLKMSNIIQEMINNEVFEYGKFIELHNKHVGNMNNLKNMMSNVICHFKLENNKNLINIYINYLFQKIVVEKKYTYKGSEDYLYRILLSGISLKDKKYTEIFMTLLRMNNYYTGLSYGIAQSDRYKYYNEDISNIFNLADNESTKEFVTRIIDDIDNNIRNIKNALNNKEKEEIVKRAVEYVKTCNRICNTTEFLVMYYDKLKNRLMDKVLSPNGEFELISLLNSKDNKELNIRMNYAVKDFMITNYINKLIQSTNKISFQSKKYQDKDTGFLDVNKCNYTILRSYVWKNNDEMLLCQESPNDPYYVSYYTDLLKAYISNPDNMLSQSFMSKKVLYDYDNSTGIINAEIGGRKYKFKATYGQIIVLSHINENGRISAKKLADETNIPLKHLGNILNSFMILKIIDRSVSNDNKDTNIVLSINSNWYNDDEYLDLVEKLENIKNMKKGVTQIDPNLLKATIIKYVKDNKECSNEDIAKIPNSSLELVNKLLAELVSSDIFIVNNNKYSIKPDSDSDESDAYGEELEKISSTIDEEVEKTVDNSIDDEVEKTVNNSNEKYEEDDISTESIDELHDNFSNKKKILDIMQEYGLSGKGATFNDIKEKYKYSSTENVKDILNELKDSGIIYVVNNKGTDNEEYMIN